MPPAFFSPYIIYGLVYRAGPGVVVTGTNKRTGESLSEITTVDSSYNIDAANFPSGYQDGDIITITVFGDFSRSTIIDLENHPDGCEVILGAAEIIRLTSAVHMTMPLVSPINTTLKLESIIEMEVL